MGREMRPIAISFILVPPDPHDVADKNQAQYKAANTLGERHREKRDSQDRRRPRPP